MAKKKLQQIVVKSIPKFQAAENLIKTIETDYLAKPKFNEPDKENTRHIERISSNKNKPIVLVNPTDKSFICTIPIILQGRLLVGEFPNLLTLYLNNAIESYNFSNEILHDTEITNSYRSGEMIRFSNQRFYNTFLLNRINAVLYLSFTIELLLNFKIPFDYKYKKGEISFDKKGIEENFAFKDKLKLVNEILKVDKKNIDNTLLNNLIELYSIRSNLAHPKTADSKLKGDYAMEHISVTFSDAVIVKHIKTVIKVLDRWEPGLLAVVG